MQTATETRFDSEYRRVRAERDEAQEALYLTVEKNARLEDELKRLKAQNSALKARIRRLV